MNLFVAHPPLAPTPSAHAPLAPSSAARWLNCPGSIRASGAAPPPRTSSYAEEGSYNIAVVVNDDGGSSTADTGNVLVQASPTITSTASSAITLGTTAPTLTDSAVLSGGFFETGTITFTVNGVARNPVPVTAARLARLPLSKLAAGSDTITATYNGDAGHAASTSAPLVEVVNPPAPMIRASGGTWTEFTA